MKKGSKVKAVEWMLPGEVADVLGVHAATVVRWTKTKTLKAVITPGGHRRILRSDVVVLSKKMGVSFK